MEVALGEKLGVVRLTNGGMFSVITDEREGTIPVKLETVDNLSTSLSIRPTYIKADIEGYEEKMLMGAAETIAAYHPKFALTTYHHTGAGEWMERFLNRINPKYKIRFKGIGTRQSGATVMLHAWT